MAGQLRRGSRVGKYRLDRKVGRGAFAEVWKARDTVENRAVAIKLAHPDAVAEWGRKKIEHEARVASRLDHPGIVSIRNADWIDGRFAIVTDLAVSNLARWDGTSWSPLGSGTDIYVYTLFAHDDGNGHDRQVQQSRHRRCGRPAVRQPRQHLRGEKPEQVAGKNNRECDEQLRHETEHRIQQFRQADDVHYTQRQQD